MENEQLVTGAVKHCPHCEHELTGEEIKRLWSNYTTSLRKTLGGPKRQKRNCPSCDMMCKSAREAWSHCRIPRNLEPAALLSYVLGRMPQDLSTAIGQSARASLEDLQEALLEILAGTLKPAERKQAVWYAGFVDRAMDKLENVA